MFGLAVGVGGATLVIRLRARNHSGNNNVALSQNVGTTPAAGEPANSSNPEPAVSTLDAQPDPPQEQSPATDADEPVLTDNDSAAAPVAAAAPIGATTAMAGPTVAAAAVVRHVRTTIATLVPMAPATAAAPPVAATDVADPMVVPAGTTLVVRLAEQLGSTISEEGQSFSASLDRDVIIDGQTVIPAGTSVTGKVIFARPVGALAGEAKLELKLTSLRVNNANVALVSSVRNFGFKIKGKSKVGRFMKGLVKRAVGDEREVVLDDQSAYSFTLGRSLQVP
jgi:hypothetical protein